MPARKEFWTMLLLLNNATRCNRAATGGNKYYGQDDDRNPDYWQ